MKVVVVGGGLVGSLMSIILAKKGEQVTLYERRPDLRNQPALRGRSINLALSQRGIAALNAAGIEDKVKEMIIPMYGRMLHSTSGKLDFVPYGVFGEAINSIDRRRLNEILLDECEKLGVKCYFEHELHDADFDDCRLKFKYGELLVEAECDFVVGADGAYSSVRRELMKKTRMNFSQEYIEHGYMELTIPASENKFQMHANSLHIWPRGSYMMIALPNLDKSFTTTLFMPFEKFEGITNEADLIAFFEANFPDSIELLGRENLLAEFFRNPVGPLVSVKCTPYHYKDKVIILGDSSHAMVPFYGQGMNCGFEDCLVLNAFMYGDTEHLPANFYRIKEKMPLADALRAYTETRHEDLKAICDLAMYNYIEMRHGVTTLSYRIRKSIESFLHRLIPSRVIPLYTMVSFSQIPYAQVVKQWNKQTYWLSIATSVTVGTLSALALGALLRRK